MQEVIGEKKSDHTRLQDKLAEVYIGIKKVEEIIHVYKEVRAKTDNDLKQYIPKLSA